MASGPDDSLIRWLYGHFGIAADMIQPAVLSRRNQACLRRAGVWSGSAARDHLAAHPEELGKALDVALLGVSSFFRDPGVFEQLRELLRSEVYEKQAGLRVLSAGASDGQELYSLAMLLDEDGLLEQSSLLGVDCRGPALERARAGQFREDQLQSLTPSRRARYFRRIGTKYVAQPFLRQRIEWRQGNILAFDEPPHFDLILCRNLAIYLTPEWAAKLWSGLTGILIPGGLLVTGKAEKPPAPLPLKCLSPCIYRKME